MHHRTIGAMILALVAAKGISAEDSSATLSELVDGADRIAVGDVGTMRRVIEDQVVHTKDGEEITGKFIFTYVNVTPTEHIVGGQVSTVTVRLLGGLHPDGTKVTTYLQAPSLSSEEKVLLFLKEAPERGPNQEVVHQIAHHHAGKFRVEGEGATARLVRPLPNSSLKIDPSQGIDESPILLSRMKQLIQAERTGQ
ncbi:MAG: hypothetical protein OXG13_01260 [Gemmatimonadaceae bacterium]|nr:hypothetical protein [Gemmatimonadaceae bacterium]